MPAPVFSIVEIIQDNSVDGVYLMSINNPLVFLVRATYSVSTPDVIYAKINSVYYNCIFYEDESATERVFYFIADEILRMELGKIEDIPQSPDTILHIPNLSKDVTILFTSSLTSDTFSDSVTISVVNAANDFESVNGAVMLNQYNNATSYYSTAINKEVYIYWYNNDASNVVEGTTYAKGFLRKCIIPDTIGLNVYVVTIDGVGYAHTVDVKPWCDGNIMLKYLDRNGYYRFMHFNSYYNRQSTPELIGHVNELITSLLTDKGDRRILGYNNNDTLTMTAMPLRYNDIFLLKDLYNSHDVQIYTTKWIRVTIQGDGITKLNKRTVKDVTITAALPKSYNITEL